MPIWHYQVHPNITSHIIFWLIHPPLTFVMWSLRWLHRRNLISQSFLHPVSITQRLFCQCDISMIARRNCTSQLIKPHVYTLNKSFGDAIWSWPWIVSIQRLLFKNTSFFLPSLHLGFLCHSSMFLYGFWVSSRSRILPLFCCAHSHELNFTFSFDHCPLGLYLILWMDSKIHYESLSGSSPLCIHWVPPVYIDYEIHWYTIIYHSTCKLHIYTVLESIFAHKQTFTQFLSQAWSSNVTRLWLQPLPVGLQFHSNWLAGWFANLSHLSLFLIFNTLLVVSLQLRNCSLVNLQLLNNFFKIVPN